MINLPNSLAAWNTPEFNNTLKTELLKLETSQLPLQQAMRQSSYVSNSDFSVSILSSHESGTDIIAKTGIFFTGIIAGSCCSDDPTPVDELQEYCELELKINKDTAEVVITLLGS